MASFKECVITLKGHALLGKMMAEQATLVFTKVKVGQGIPDIPLEELEDIVDYKLDGKILGAKAYPTERRTSIKSYFTNENLNGFFVFREIGVYANDPDEGEILYAYANAGDTGDYIGGFDGKHITEENFEINVYTANTSDIKAVISHSCKAEEIEFDNEGTGLESDNISDAIKELEDKQKECGEDSLFTLNKHLNHGLQKYPDLIAFEVNKGFGIEGFGEYVYGGKNEKTLRAVAKYIDRNIIEISLSKELSADIDYIKISDNEYAIDSLEDIIYLRLI